MSIRNHSTATLSSVRPGRRCHRHRGGSLMPLAACFIAAGCSDSDGPPPVPVPMPVTNQAPTFTSANTATVTEGTAMAFYNAAATDPDGDALTFSIAGGDDEAAFSITSAGALSFVTAPNADTPGDTDMNNVYLVTLDVSDGNASASLDLQVTVEPSASSFAAQRVVASGLFQPLYVLGRGDGTNRIFILEKTGGILIFDRDTGVLQTTPFLDVSSTISTDGESGLLGMALAPDFQTSGVFYIHVNNTAGDTEIRRYTVSSNNPDRADASSADVILTVDQPTPDHNGGWIGFGPDSYLYITLGDGGQTPNQSQDTSTLFGSVLRIDPAGDDFPADDMRDYAIPADNPFVGSGGLDEIFVYGLRNPYRASFDRETGDLYIGDVGAAAIEEINILPAGSSGLNYGWPLFEGTRLNIAGSSEVGLTRPVAEYAHGIGDRQGNSVIGGYVYQGPAASLQGRYVFGDFISENIWSIDAADAVQGQTIASSQFTVETGAFVPDSGAIGMITSFGEDDDANLYITDLDEEVFVVVAQ